MALPSIELHPALVFDCDNCGREQFISVAVEERDDGDLNVHFPEDIQCRACGVKYIVQKATSILPITYGGHDL